jgi:hypothetical protein
MRQTVSPLLRQRYRLRFVGIDRFGGGTPLALVYSAIYTLTRGLGMPVHPWHHLTFWTATTILNMNKSSDADGSL